MEAKINTAISEQDLSGFHFFSGVTEEQLHLRGEFNRGAEFGISDGRYLLHTVTKGSVVKSYVLL